MDLDLAGKAVLVTGGSDGLGRAVCRSLVSEGASVALCARNVERLEATARDLRASGGNVLDVPADVTRLDDLRRFVDEAMERFGRIDGLVNNAGRSSAKLLANSEDGDFYEDMDLKLHSAVRLTRLALHELRRTRGSVVNVLAISAKTPGAGSTPTSVSRAAGLALSKALSKELGPSGIRVNAVLVGYIESAQWERRAAATGVSPEELYAADREGRRHPPRAGRGRSGVCRPGGLPPLVEGELRDGRRGERRRRRLRRRLKTCASVQ